MGFGMGGASPSVPMPPPAAYPPTLGSADVSAAAQQAKSRARAAEGMGLDNTVQTSPEGVKNQTETAKSTLLGQ
jgi:hypothetical protein